MRILACTLSLSLSLYICVLQRQEDGRIYLVGCVAFITLKLPKQLSIDKLIRCPWSSVYDCSSSRLAASTSASMARSCDPRSASGWYFYKMEARMTHLLERIGLGLGSTGAPLDDVALIELRSLSWVIVRHQ